MHTGYKIAIGAAIYWWWSRNRGPGPCLTAQGLPCPPAGRVRGGAFCGDPIIGHGRLLRWADFLQAKAAFTPQGLTYTGYVSRRDNAGEFSAQDSVDFRQGLARASCERQAEIDSALEALKTSGTPEQIIKMSPAATFEYARFRTSGGPALRGIIVRNGKQIGTIGLATASSGSIFSDVYDYVEGKVQDLAGYAADKVKEYLEGEIERAEAQARQAIDKCAQDPGACL